jgi:hypothetical protein
VGASTSYNPMGLHGLLKTYLLRGFLSPNTLLPRAGLACSLKEN